MIDSNFEYAESRWQDIFKHLKSSGFDVYSPGVKVGECMSEYVVIKNDGSSKISGISTDDDLYAVMCYVPKQAYSKLEPMVQKVKKAMKELEPMIMPYGSQTPSYYDDGYKAHMISIEYKNHKKIL
nr:MAG TPA: tail completion protein [Caudoviricetes sp.]